MEATHYWCVLMKCQLHKVNSADIFACCQPVEENVFSRATSVPTCVSRVDEFSGCLTELTIPAAKKKDNVDVLHDILNAWLCSI